MERSRAFRELRSLVIQASGEMSESRVALGAGCNPTSIQHWLRQRDVRVKTKTLIRVLPRLRAWMTWVDGYKAGQLEGNALAENRPLTSGEMVAELRTRLIQALLSRTPKQIALGCEATPAQVLAWIAGQGNTVDRNDMSRALGHLRHLTAWPPAGAAEPAKIRAAAAV